MTKTDFIPDYQSDISIDPSRLDEECLIQAVHYSQYGELLANARKERDLAHEKVKTTRSMLIAEAHNNPSILPGKPEKNPKDSIVEAYYRNHIDYKNAKKELIQAEYKVALLEVAESAMRHRRDMLGILQQLYTSQYFAGPKEPRVLEPGKRMTDLARGKETQRERNSLNLKRSRKK